MSVKWEDVKPGDKIKVRQNGMVSEDWMTVTAVGGNAYGPYAQVDHWAFYSDDSEITDHQPAPRKVEVTLGKPLPPGDDPSTRYPAKYGYVCAARNYADGRTDVYLNSSGPVSLAPDVARRLALDILATVGIED